MKNFTLPVIHLVYQDLDISYAALIYHVLLLILPNFPFTASETIGNNYLKTWYIRVASRVAERLQT